MFEPNVPELFHGDSFSSLMALLDVRRRDEDVRVVHGAILIAKWFIERARSEGTSAYGSNNMKQLNLFVEQVAQGINNSQIEGEDAGYRDDIKTVVGAEPVVPVLVLTDEAVIDLRMPQFDKINGHNGNGHTISFGPVSVPGH